MGERAVVKSDQEWREQLTPAQYEILRRQGRKRPERQAGKYCQNVSFHANSPNPSFQSSGFIFERSSELRL